MPRYNFSITTPRGETFQAVECYSFEEAVKFVEKAIKERDLQFEAIEAERAAKDPEIDEKDLQEIEEEEEELDTEDGEPTA